MFLNDAGRHLYGADEDKAHKANHCTFTAAGIIRFHRAVKAGDEIGVKYGKDYWEKRNEATGHGKKTT